MGKEKRGREGERERRREREKWEEEREKNGRKRGRKMGGREGRDTGEEDRGRKTWGGGQRRGRQGEKKEKKNKMSQKESFDLIFCAKLSITFSLVGNSFNLTINPDYISAFNKNC